MSRILVITLSLCKMVTMKEINVNHSQELTLLDNVIGNKISDDRDSEVMAIDSDHFRLYVAESSIDASLGDGVFARTHFKEGSILCEYRGPIVPSHVFIDSDRKMGMKFEGKEYNIIGDGICATINDCFDISNYFETGKRQCHSGFEHNAGVILEPLSTKVLLYAKRDIVAGEEIFYDYNGGVDEGSGLYWNFHAVSTTTNDDDNN
jgi:hypothetical protein